MKATAMSTPAVANTHTLWRDNLTSQGTEDRTVATVAPSPNSTSNEELVVERTPGERREAAGEVGSGEKEVRVPLSEERVQVEKKPVVNEEVRVGKRQVQETKRVSDTVRHEELREEHEGPVKDERLEETEKKKKRTA
jgi:uncharacterized protein (TIGR02271 family)